MDDGEAGPSHIIINEDGDQLQEVNSVHHGTTYIVKLGNSITDSNSGQLLPNYVTAAIDSSEKDHEESGIGFEIIEEPLLNDSAVVENRLFFESDYSLEKAVHHAKDSLSAIIIERSKDESLINKSEENQDNSHKRYPGNKYTAVDNNRYAVTSSTNSAVASSQTKTLSVTNTPIKLECPDHESDEKVKNKTYEVIKRTTVEAFVKMVVCRKITVQKKDAKTGEILDVDVKMEEEEPVVLDVDFIETSEDVVSGHVSKHNTDSMKGTAVTDRGLRVLSAGSENNQKINKNKGLFKSSVLQTTIQRGTSKCMQSDKNSSQTSSRGNFDSKNALQKKAEKTSKINSDSDDQWMEELEDDSADYVPHLRSKSKHLDGKSRGIPKEAEKTLTICEDNSGSDLPGLVKVKEGGADINIPKKRGRKRKWDRTIGLAANMRQCQFCNKYFDSVVSCSKHMKKGDCVSPQFCFICSKNFDSEQQLEAHISSHGNENKSLSYNCTDCRRSYRTKAGYVKHFRMGTCKKREAFEDGETGDFTCELCDSRFSTLEYLQLHHYKVHENPKDRHMCPDCGKTFYSLQGFQRHRAGRPCTEPLKCHICGKTYKAKESFKLHMKHHKSEITGITYNCDECGRSYMTETALTKHKLLHTGIKPYKCETCGKEFAMRYQVKDHARMHSGEKPYTCSLCGVAFSNKGHLGRHIRSHENGTLLRRGRPKKVQDTDSGARGDTEIKLIELGQTLQTIDGKTIQVVDGKIFNSQGDGPPMIIQADTNTIIIAEGWPDGSGVPVSQAVIVDDKTGIVNN